MAENNAIGYVILGIVAIMAVVGLVLLFTGAQKTGQVARAGYDLGWYERANPYEFPNVAPYRRGQLPEPAQFRQDTTRQAGSSNEAEKMVTQKRDWPQQPGIYGTY